MGVRESIIGRMRRNGGEARCAPRRRGHGSRAGNGARGVTERVGCWARAMRASGTCWASGTERTGIRRPGGNDERRGAAGAAERERGQTMSEGIRAGPAEGRTVRVVLVDDHRMFRTGVQAEIGETERTGVEVVGEAADVDQAVAVITATRPEVVLLDVHLPGRRRRRGAAPLRGTDGRCRAAGPLPGAVGVRRRRGRHRRDPRRRTRVRHQDHHRHRTWSTPSSGSPTATPSSRRGWPVSSWTPSPRPTPRRSTRTWTG